MKFDSKFLVLILTVTLLVGCKTKSDSNSTPPIIQGQIETSGTPAQASPSQREGGITSGGGGTLPAERPKVEDIGTYVKRANTVLVYYFKLLEQVHHDQKPINFDKKEYFKLLFDGGVTIYDVLDTKYPDVQFDKPCLDYDGQEVDGSILASTRAQYCISAHLISKKISKADAFIEVTALVAHELSHFLGANEHTAAEIQTDLAKLFRSRFVNERSLNDFIKKSLDHANQRSRYVDRFMKAVESPDESEKIFNDLIDYDSYNTGILYFGYYDDQYSSYQEQAFSFLSFEERQQYNFYQDQIYAIELFVCLNQTSQPVRQKLCQNRIDNLFKGRDFVEWQEINPKATESWKTKRIYRIKSLSDSDFVQAPYMYYGMITFFSAWGPHYLSPRFLASPFAEPSAVSPWEKNAGNYKVIDQNCSTDLLSLDRVPLLSKLSIELVDFDVAKVLALKETTNFGESISYFPSFIGISINSDFLKKQGAATIYASENKTHRVLVSEGQAYGQEYDFISQTDVFERTETGYQLKRTKLVQDQRYGVHINPRFFECTYSLSKEP